MSTDQQILLLNSAMTQLMRHIRCIDDQHGIGRARLSALAVLHFGGDCTLSDLAQSEMVSRATMHHVLNGLEEDDLVVRKVDPNDRRRHLITLTSKGHKKINAAHQARLSYLKQLVAEVDAQELAVTAATLDAVRSRSWQLLEGEMK